MPSSSLQLYRALIPGHSGVPDPTVNVWLELAATFHLASQCGDAYAFLCVTWAAAHIEPDVAAGRIGRRSGQACVPTPTTTRDSPGAHTATVYWGWYLERLGTRDAAFPTRVGPGC